MPTRKKNAKIPPKFSFINLSFEIQDQSWLKRHSGAARSHAAYWGGPAKQQHQAEKEKTGSASKGGKNAPVAFVDATREAEDDEQLPYIRRGSENAQFKQSMPLRISETAGNTALPALRFCGEDFVKRFVMCDEGDDAVMLNGFLLLSYAHSMALSGQGSKIRLLGLKGQVMRRLAAKMDTSNGVLSPRCLTAILALGTAIVCLVSQDLPNGLNMLDYINATMKDDHLCGPDSAHKAKCAIEEQTVHEQAMRKLHSRSKARFKDSDSLALLQYVSNYMDISKALGVANNQICPLKEIENLFPKVGSCNDCLIPSDWVSPLTCIWTTTSVIGCAESPILALSRLMNNWLATFLDGDSRILPPTEQSVKMRAILRKDIEKCTSMAKSFSMEATAMYECCRWASSVMLIVDKLGIPIHIAAQHARIRPRLVRRLRMTDLLSLWGNHRGLLFWVTAICHFATAGQCFPLIGTTLLARFAQEMSTLECCPEIAIKPLKRLKTFESYCCSFPSDNQDPHDSM